MAFPFKSKFQTNTKLKDCAVHDYDHIGENYASTGLWVNLIQEALNAWASRQKPLIKPIAVNGKFDKITGDLVELYKASQKPPLLNYAGKIDRIVGKKTVKSLDDELAGGGISPVIEIPFICGPDVTNQIRRVWTQIQVDFRSLTFSQKFKACNKIFLPFQLPENPMDLLGGDFSIESLKSKARQFADINSWDTLPLFQGASQWLRTPPIFDPQKNRPCAAPTSKKPEAPPFDDAHEDPDTCSNTVQVAGKCWLNGSVNYGTFGIMVKLCNDFATTESIFLIPPGPVFKNIYTLEWAKMLIRAYKRFGSNPEGAIIPIAWTEATFRGGPSGIPSIAENRPRCKCTNDCGGDVVTWDYVWEPNKSRNQAKNPK